MARRSSDYRFACVGPVLRVLLALLISFSARALELRIDAQPACDATAGIAQLRLELTDQTPAVRSCAAFALGNLGDKARVVVPQLMEMLTDLDVKRGGRRIALRVYDGTPWRFRDPNAVNYDQGNARISMLSDVSGLLPTNPAMRPEQQMHRVSLEIPYTIIPGGPRNYPAWTVAFATDRDVAVVPARERYARPDRTGLYRSLEGDYDVTSIVVFETDQGKRIQRATGAVAAKTLITTTPADEAAWALARIGGDDVLYGLIEMLPEPAAHGFFDKTWLKRRAAIRTLGHLGDARAVQPLIDAMSNDREPLNRGFALMALVEIGDERAIPALIDALEAKVPKRRLLARRGLVSLTKLDLGADRNIWHGWWACRRQAGSDCDAQAKRAATQRESLSSETVDSPADR